MLKGVTHAPANSGTTSNGRSTPVSSPLSLPPPAPVSAPAPAVAPARANGNSTSRFSGSGISSNVGASRANIDQIMGMEMGYTEEQVIGALRASFDNPDQAAELLFNGGPDLQGLQNVSSPPQPPPNLNFLANLSNSTPGGVASIPGFPQGPPILQQQQRQPRRDSSSMLMDSMGGLGGMGGMGGLGGLGALAGMTGMGGPGGGAAPTEIDPAQVQAIRRMVAENPLLTGPLIESLMETDPVGAAGLSVDDPDGILRYFDQIGQEASGQGPPAPLLAPTPASVTIPPGTETQTAAVNSKEAASIERMKAMGYPENAVLEAFIVSGRNEELALNILIEGGIE
ncbi:hypothetical protein BC827DRAFT_95097 [Russula dissimulans]|nr:hypothetical protein BC827DRAFT_95097 [Russula dissimulans]